jgi:lysophospholipase L1-like esterase
MTLVFKLVLISLSTLFALAIAEVALRVAGMGFGHSPLWSDPVLHHVHPRDYRFRLDVPTTDEIAQHDVYYDRNGEVADPAAPMRVPVSPRYRVALMGDSFVEANQVPWRESFAGRLTRSGGETTYVRNYGVAGYSPIIYRLLWRNRVDQFHPTHVFVLLSGNDVRDDNGYGAIATRDAAGNVVGVPGPSDLFLLRLMRHSYVIRFFEMMRLKLLWAWLHRGQSAAQRVIGGDVEENPEITPQTSQYVLDLAGGVTASGAQFVLMAVPSRYRLHHPNEPGPEFSDRWRAWAAQHGVTFVDLTGPFHAAYARGINPFFVLDGHINANGHALVAEAIRARYPELFPAR